MSDKRKFQNRNKRVIKVPHRSDDDIFCFCVGLETRSEDFTLKSCGMELTRSIELRVCPDCKERYIPGPTIEQMEAEIKAKVLAKAKERFDVLEGHKHYSYLQDTDVFVIGYLPSYGNHSPVAFKEDIEKGLIYNYDNQANLVSIEIIGFYGGFTKQVKNNYV